MLFPSVTYCGRLLIISMNILQLVTYTGSSTTTFIKNVTLANIKKSQSGLCLLSQQLINEALNVSLVSLLVSIE